MKRLNLPKYYCSAKEDNQVVEKSFLEDISEEKTISPEELEHLTYGAFMLQALDSPDQVNYDRIYS